MNKLWTLLTTPFLGTPVPPPTFPPPMLTLDTDQAPEDNTGDDELLDEDDDAEYYEVEYDLDDNDDDNDGLYGEEVIE